MERIVITGPFQETGGVAQFVKSLSYQFNENVLLFQRGKRKNNSGLNFALPLYNHSYYNFCKPPTKGYSGATFILIVIKIASNRVSQIIAITSLIKRKVPIF